MEAEDVVEIYKLLTSNGIDVWLDGGWGVDALLGKQTRLHSDLDIVVEEKDINKLRKILEKEGYKDIPRDDTSAWNFILGDQRGHLIDIHVFTHDSKGNGLYGDKGLTYPAASFLGKGTINVVDVKTISAEQIVKFLSPWLYKKREKHIKDVTLLCNRFGISYPPELEG